MFVVRDGVQQSDMSVVSRSLPPDTVASAPQSGLSIGQDVWAWGRRVLPMLWGELLVWHHSPAQH